MRVSAHAVPFSEILPWRDAYRIEMNCQIVHDSLSQRGGWTESYLLTLGQTTIGYGAALIAGPWLGTRTLFEFYLLPEHRTHLVDAFEALRDASAADHILVQTNDALLATMLHLFASNVVSEKLVFADQLVTTLQVPDAVFRELTPADARRFFPINANPSVLTSSNSPAPLSPPAASRLITIRPIVTSSWKSPRRFAAAVWAAISCRN